MSGTGISIACILLIGILGTESLAVKDPIPFGKQRLDDFFFVKNGTVFHQFVRIPIFSLIRSVQFRISNLEPRSLWWYCESRRTISISIRGTNGIIDCK